jgi:hypothetical protein
MNELVDPSHLGQILELAAIIPVQEHALATHELVQGHRHVWISAGVRER